MLATALVASVADPGTFRSGRNFSAWIGLVPKQQSSGGKDRLGSISKQGDSSCQPGAVHTWHIASVIAARRHVRSWVSTGSDRLVAKVTRLTQSRPPRSPRYQPTSRRLHLIPAPQELPARNSGAECQQVVTGSSHQSLIGQRSNVGVAHQPVTKKQS